MPSSEADTFRLQSLHFLAIPIALLAAFLVGCGSKLPPGAKPTKKVTVTVTYKGAPVDGAVVTFVNVDGPPSANGRTDAQGKTQLKTYVDGDGATLGQHKVIVEKSEAVGGQTIGPEDPKYDPNAPPPTIKHHVPQKYGSIATSGLTAEVKDGSPNEFSFELKD
jgi:hypothetical protein